MNKDIKPEYRELLKILSCFLHKEKYIPSDRCEIALLKKLADEQSVIGIVGYMLRQGIDEWAKIFYATCTETVQRIDAFKVLEKTLDREKIDHLMVKGFVVREDYPVPELRTFGDLDIIIHPEDRKRLDNLMRELGYFCEENWEPSYAYRMERELYEFHTELLDKDPTDKVDFKRFFSEPWKHAIKTGEYRYILDPEFCFLYVFVHLAKHVSARGAGLRMYLDLAVLLQKNKVDWKKIAEYVRQIKMERFLDTVLSAVEEWFGVEGQIPHQKVDRKVLDNLLVFTIEGGIFGFYGEDRSTMMLRESKNGKFGLILRRIFPSAKDISDRYSYLKKKPWLLPVAWIHRVVLNRRRMQEEGQLLKEIASSDIEHLEQLKKLYREIGLY